MISLIIKKKTSYYALWNLFLLLAAPAMPIFMMISFSIDAKDTLLDVLKETWFVFLILILFALYPLDYIFWQIKGYEQVEFDINKFTRTRRGKIFRNKFIIHTTDIFSIEEQAYYPETFTSSFFRNPLLLSKTIGETGGRILIRYGKNGKHKFDFGLGLTSEEARIYVEEMNKVLSLSKHSQA